MASIDAVIATNFPSISTHEHLAVGSPDVQICNKIRHMLYASSVKAIDSPYAIIHERYFYPFIPWGQLGNARANDTLAAPN